MRSNIEFPPLPAPPDEDYIRVIPLGGLGEVGMNCMLIECNGDIIVIDCGVTFPQIDVFGIDHLFADLEYLESHRDRLVGVILTHGHEDHIGAVPHLAALFPNVPFYGTRYTLALLHRKLSEYRLDNVRLQLIKPRESIKIGVFTLEPVAMTHSIPDAIGLALNTPLGRIFHTGDFKLEDEPIVGWRADQERIEELGAEGILCLMSDSTNVGRTHESISEKEVAKNLTKVVKEQGGRVLVTLFSTNLHRVQSLIDAAADTGRKVGLLGRSLHNNVGIARELGILRVKANNLFVELEDLADLPAHRQLILCTGSQGEPRAGLSRIARGEHRQIRIEEGDTVIFSSRKIPGNELSIQKVMDSLRKFGAKVITERDAPIHTTGHAHRPEQIRMLHWTDPEIFVPVHGVFSMLEQHAKVAQDEGVGETEVLSNGRVLEITASTLDVIGEVTSGRRFSGGGLVGSRRDRVFKQRRVMAGEGILVATLVFRTDKRRLVQGPVVRSLGAVLDEDRSFLHEVLEEHIIRKVASAPREVQEDAEELREYVRVSMRRWFRSMYRTKPAIEVIVHDMTPEGPK